MANTRGKRKETAPVDEVMEKVDMTTPLADEIMEKETSPVDEVMEKETSPVKFEKGIGEHAMAEGYVTGTVNCQNLNVRKAPAMGSTILKIIPKDTKVTILGSVNDAWYKVRVGEIETGFCMKEFMQIP